MSAKDSDAGSKEDSKQADMPIDSLTDPDLKIILLGDSAVGKSKLIERYLMNEYNPRQLSTYALTLFRKEIELEGETSKTLVGKYIAASVQCSFVWSNSLSPLMRFIAIDPFIHRKYITESSH